MCGFSGFTGMYANREEIIKKMSERIRHRGPDMGGSFVYGDTDKNAVTLGSEDYPFSISVKQVHSLWFHRINQWQLYLTEKSTIFWN